MPDMPDQQLQIKVQGLEKIEEYLKQQVSDLEDDRQELYDLLKEDKKIIHDLKIRVRSLELSEDKLKKRFNQMSEEESRLIKENDNLMNKIHELELSLSLPTKRTGINESQMTDYYEPEQLQNLRSQLLERDKEIENLEKRTKKETTHKSIDTEDLKSKEDEMEKELEISKLKDELESLRMKIDLKKGTLKEVQTEESLFDKGRHTEVQSDESFFHKKATKRAWTQTEGSIFDDQQRFAIECQTDDVEVQDIRIRRNKEVQVEMVEKSFLNTGSQTEEDYSWRDKLKIFERKLLDAENEIRKKDEEFDELQRVTNEKFKEISRKELEGQEQQDKIERLSKEGKMLKELFDKFVESSKSEKTRHEEEMKRLKGIVTTKDADLENATQDREKAFEKLRATQMDLVNAEMTRDEKAGILLNKVLEITQLKKNISDKDEELRTLWTDMNKIQANYSNYIETSETERALLENRLKGLMRDAEIKNDELEMTNKELEKITEKLKEREREIISLANSKNELLKECSEMKKIVKDKDDELKLILADLNNLQNKNVALAQEHERCFPTQEEMTRNLEVCKNDLKLLKEKNLDLTRAVDANEYKVELLTSKNSNQEELIKTLEDENLQLKEKINKTELKTEFLNSTNEQRMRLITSTILKQQAEKKSEETSTASQISFLKKSLQNKDEEIQLLTNDINNLHKKYLDALERSAPNEEDLQENVKASSRLHSELTRKEDEIKTLMNNEETLQKKVFGLMEVIQQNTETSEKEKSKLVRDLKEKILHMEANNKKLDEVMQELNDAKLELNENEKKMTDLKDKLAQATNALKVSSQHNKELLLHQKNADRIASEKRDLEKQLEELGKKYFIEITELKKKLEFSSKEKGDLEKNLNELKVRTARMENEIYQKNQLQLKIAELISIHQEKDKQLAKLSEKLNSMGNEINNLLSEKRNFLQKENYYKSLQKEFDQLSVTSQRQTQDLKSSRSRENELSVKLRERDAMIKELNDELSDCEELSRKLNILNISR